MLLGGFGCKVVLRHCILSRCCLRRGGARWLVGVYTSQNRRGRMIWTVTRLAPVWSGLGEVVYTPVEGVGMKSGGGSGTILYFLSIRVRLS